ncbi:hypothetical protein Aeqsu_2966 [Aequorivita sublithincola DSM 14238]|uniref:DUF4249 domain-containing protein n=2 Tax=Aequorivita TaxID=153265 RepID=I3YZI8_AEQSU|nr:DUF4249 domain-containing protein [Aequorivita sublithincola]AFL82406.1 hypothetical protein Aeqsu_2966 [Aequorivita sublithincola DSM 14238]
MRTKFLYIVLFLVTLFQWSCTEPYEIETVIYENVLVVESTITDEMKPQIVKLSRTSPLENVDVLLESNATVHVSSSDGQNYEFYWNNDLGYYVSYNPFNAQPNISYTLSINTADGKNYTSSPVVLPPRVEMEQIYAETITDPNQKKDGVQVLVNTTDPTGNSKYFRYEYEETYKIVAPNPTKYYTQIIDYNPDEGTYKIILSPRIPEEICYSTEISTGITQASTSDFSENKVFRFPVRYLSKLDSKIQTRYSLLVKQYVQSVEAFTFYKIIKDLGSIQSLLSQGQPGYASGNMVSETNPEEKVLGFFEASSMTSKRIYFNYDDFGFKKPPYFVECEILQYDYYKGPSPFGFNEREALYDRITYDDYQVLSVNSRLVYRIVQPECSVCTYFSSNVKPDFWED